MFGYPQKDKENKWEKDNGGNESILFKHMAYEPNRAT